MRSQNSWAFDARFLGGVLVAVFTCSGWRSPYARAPRNESGAYL